MLIIGIVLVIFLMIAPHNKQARKATSKELLSGIILVSLMILTLILKYNYTHIFIIDFLFGGSKYGGRLIIFWVVVILLFLIIGLPIEKRMAARKKETNEKK